MSDARRGDPNARTPLAWLALLALPPALIAVLQLGRLHPDEVFQMLEPAHQFAFGNTVLPWEWEDGLRNWAVPGTFGWLLKACAALGIDDPQGRRAVLEVPQVALHWAALCALFRMVRRRLPEGAGWTRDALWAVALCALYAPVLHYAGRTLSESISTPLMLIAIERIEVRGRSRWHYVLGGVLLGSAIVVRYGSGVFAAAAGLWLLKDRRLRDSIALAFGGVLPLIGVGLLDWATWGAPFHSFRTYFGFNVASSAAAERFGAEPFWFYVPWMVVAVSFWAWPALLFFLTTRRAGPAHTGPRGLPAPIGPLLFCTGWYLLVISLVEHKEPRFLYPALVFVTAAAAPTWVALLRGLPTRVRTVGLGLSLAVGLSLLGFRTDFAPKRAGQFQMFVKAARNGTGVVLLHSGVWGAPGQFYSGTRPWVLCDIAEKRCLRDAIADPTFNRVVGWRDEGLTQLKRAGFRPIDKRGSVVLWGRRASAGTERLADRGARR